MIFTHLLYDLCELLPGSALLQSYRSVHDAVLNYSSKLRSTFAPMCAAAVTIQGVQDSWIKHDRISTRTRKILSTHRKRRRDDIR